VKSIFKPIETGNQKTEPLIKEGDLKKDSSVSGPNFVSEPQQKEFEDT
jgi:hypothetical protein